MSCQMPSCYKPLRCMSREINKFIFFINAEAISCMMAGGKKKENIHNDLFLSRCTNEKKFFMVSFVSVHCINFLSLQPFTYFSVYPTQSTNCHPRFYAFKGDSFFSAHFRSCVVYSICLETHANQEFFYIHFSLDFYSVMQMMGSFKLKKEEESILSKNLFFLSLFYMLINW